MIYLFLHFTLRNLVLQRAEKIYTHTRTALLFSCAVRRFTTHCSFVSQAPLCLPHIVLLIMYERHVLLYDQHAWVTGAAMALQRRSPSYEAAPSIASTLERNPLEAPPSSSWTVSENQSHKQNDKGATNQCTGRKRQQNRTKMKTNKKQ